MTARNTGKKLKPVLLRVSHFTPGSGKSKGGIVVYKSHPGPRCPTTMLPRRCTMLVDPQNHSNVRIATDIDDDFIERCVSIVYVLAWTQQWVLSNIDFDELKPELPE